MRENTNKILFVNTLILYLKLLINSVIGLFSTRYTLQALGVVDYGLYAVLGSIVTFIAIINTIMISSSHRYIAVAIGKKDIAETNKVFNICFLIHAVIACFTIILAVPIGDWYVLNYLNYNGDINVALHVFNISVIASAFTFLGVPYNALLMAKEKFLVFSIPDVVSHILKLLFVIILVDHFTNKLELYAIAMALLTAYPTIVFIRYCRNHYIEQCSFHLVRDKSKYKEVLSFSSWVAYGAFAYVGKSQGAAILINSFFNTAMNTALGVANSVNSIINHFSQNISKPIAPQITKSYAAGDMKRCETLLIMSTKMTYLVMLIISSPFIVCTEWILDLWLGKVPPYAVGFLYLIVADSLIESLNSGIKEIIFASGKIKLFQIVPSTIKLLSIGVAFIAMKIIRDPYTIQYVYIGFTAINFFVTQLILNYTLKFNNMLLIKKSYIPSLLLTILFAPFVFIHNNMHPIVMIVLSVLYLLTLSYIMVLNANERRVVVQAIRKFSNYRRR